MESQPVIVTDCTECVDFLGFPGGYDFHGDGEVVFNEFFGTKNPFAGLVCVIGRLFRGTGGQCEDVVWEEVWRVAWNVKLDKDL